MTVVPESATNTPGTVDAYIATSADLLRTIAEVLDVRTILPRLSEIANRILPHDALAMGSVDAAGQLVFEAATADLHDLRAHALETPFPEDIIIGDLTAQDLPVVRGMSAAPRWRRAGTGRCSRPPRGPAIWCSASDSGRSTLTRTSAAICRWLAAFVEHIAVAVSHEQLATAAREAADGRARASELDARVRSLSHELGTGAHSRVVGESVEWRGVLRKATQVASTDTTVLITGESGTGKEVVARFIHAASVRKSRPFVALNCAALPEQLLESELFGYERGAFTSAQQAKPGQVELASGGVLFLDEVSEMSLSAQAKFLRVLQEREFQRLGGTRLLKANIRVIAATNRDLRKAVERGDFREDLFYRLGVFDIQIPPLRERPSDIVPLSETFLQEIGRSFGRPAGWSDA